MDASRGMLAAVRRGVRRLGWDVARYPGAMDPGQLRAVLLRHLGVDLVIDVGANVGQYGHHLRARGYAGRIVSFEPMAAAHAALSRAAGRDAGWEVVRSAVGAEAGEVVLHVARNSISSSVLPMLDRHLATAPMSEYVAEEVVPVERLDVLAAHAVTTAEAPFLKVDTQGYEAAVLEGASGILDRFVGLELELSLQPLYGGQQLMDQTVAQLAERGFRLARLSPGLTDRRTGETLQVDGIFTRTG